MTRNDLLNAIIDDGIMEITLNYLRRDQEAKRKGGIAGFEACRGLSNQALLDLREETKVKVKKSELLKDLDQYWYDRMFDAQVEWVLNVLSAALHHHGRPILSDFTLRGSSKANEILNGAPLLGNTVVE